MFFANEQRENVREENPGITFGTYWPRPPPRPSPSPLLTPSTGQVGKLLGERWKALNDKQRAPYEAKAAADKKRYEDEKQAYNVRLPPKRTPPCSALTSPASGRRRRGRVVLDVLFLADLLRSRGLELNDKS